MKIKEYNIQSELGKGGMATVHLAEDEKFKHPVAIKLLNKEFINNGNIRNRFLAEARNLFKMNHPNIIKVTDLIDEGDTVAFVMEYLNGQTLKDYLDSKGKLSDEEIKKLFIQMLDAVGYVHEQGLIHRDIKPSNFMISNKGVVKLLDFGIAKNTDNTSAEYTQTGTTQSMGTPMYMSPEQIKSTKEVTAQTDIYSLGVVLWQMVTCKKPYDINTISAFELQTKIVNEKLAPTNTLFDVVITGASAKDLKDRYINCFQFKNELLHKPEDLESTILYVQNVMQDNRLPEIATRVDDFQSVYFDEVTIGTQIWMTSNLNVDKFRNGDTIPKAATYEEWLKARDKEQPAWCYYLNELSNGIKYGKLYNWYAVNDPRGLAPSGYHIPSDNEWTILTNYLGVNSKTGTKMKSTSGWNQNNYLLTDQNGTNISGFSAVPCGYSHVDGPFDNVGKKVTWWSSTEFSKKNAWTRSLNCFNGYVEKDYNNKRSGFSVRCLRD